MPTLTQQPPAPYAFIDKEKYLDILCTQNLKSTRLDTWKGIIVENFTDSANVLVVQVLYWYNHVTYIALVNL